MGISYICSCMCVSLDILQHKVTQYIYKYMCIANKLFI